MSEGYKIVYEGGSGEIEEKKSRFIATVLPVNSEEDATAFIAAMKKKYWDARHNCFAYVIGKNNELQRCSDDGEPSGTALSCVWWDLRERERLPLQRVWRRRLTKSMSVSALAVSGMKRRSEGTERPMWEPCLGDWQQGFARRESKIR